MAVAVHPEDARYAALVALGPTRLLALERAKLESLLDKVAAIQVAPAASQPQFNRILEQRDAIITDLSRGTPGAADRLYDMLQRFRISLGEAPVPVVTEETPAVP